MSAVSARLGVALSLGAVRNDWRGIGFAQRRAGTEGFRLGAASFCSLLAAAILPDLRAFNIGCRDRCHLMLAKYHRRAATPFCASAALRQPNATL